MQPDGTSHDDKSHDDKSPDDKSPDNAIERLAADRAGAVDDAATPAERRRAWARFVPVALAALAEGIVRDAFVVGAVLFSLVVTVMGATSGQPGWIVAGVVVGVIGTVLPFLALARRWPLRAQWAVLVGIVVAQVVMMTLFWG